MINATFTRQSAIALAFVAILTAGFLTWGFYLGGFGPGKDTEVHPLFTPNPPIEGVRLAS